MLWPVNIVKARLYREPERRLFLSRLHCILEATSLSDGGSRPQQHTWNSKALIFPVQIYCCTIVYIFNILWRLKVKSFKTFYSKEEASSVLFILTYPSRILATNRGGSHYSCEDVSPVTYTYLLTCSLFYHLVMNVWLIFLTLKPLL